ncbi:hypothetical protein BDZ89DRAFT_1142538 [Hymenopellis radicata]|nr:hypothetical protein BDZ89DRAFT_1142538 [Hymenopellis radicata]
MLCTSCGELFRYLDVEVCFKCKKIAELTSPAEKEAMAMQPQCTDCGVVFPRMSNALCGRCKKRAESEDSTQGTYLFLLLNHVELISFVADTAGTILQRAAQHTEETATYNRLGEGRPKSSQPSSSGLNHGLQNANKAKAVLALNKELSVAKNRNKVDTILLTARLFLQSGDSKPVRPDTMYNHVHNTNAQMAVDKTLNDFLSKIKTEFTKSAAGAKYAGWDVAWDQDPTWIIKGNTNANSFAIESAWKRGSFHKMLADPNIRLRLKIPDKKTFTWTLNLDLVMEASEPDFDNDDDDTYEPSRRSISKSRPRSSGVKRTSKSSTARSSSRSLSRSATPPVSRSASPSVNTSAANPASKYRSLFRADIEPVQYESFLVTSFTQAVLDEACGKVVLKTVVPKADNEPNLLVAQDWTTEGSSSLLGQGACKNVFKGSVDKVSVALAQNKTASSTVDQNLEDLTVELRSLHQLSYFMDSFLQRMKINHVKYDAAISWNSKPSYILHVDNTSREWGSSNASQSMPFPDVLVTPLIDSAMAKFMKFSGTEDFEENTGPIGRMLEAFTHHVVQDSEQSILPSDLQGFVFPSGEVILIDAQMHTSRGQNGFADKGMPLIQAWIDSHRCTQWCKDLDLQPFQQRKSRRPSRAPMGLSNLMNPLNVDPIQKEEGEVIDLNSPSP